MGHLLIMHHEGRIKLCNTMVWFSNEDKLLSCLLFKKHSGTQKKEGVIQTVNPLIQRKNDTGQASVSEVQGLSNRR